MSDPNNSQNPFDPQGQSQQDQNGAQYQPNQQPQYGAYDSNHGGQYPPQQGGGQSGQGGLQDGPQSQQGYGQPYYGPYATNPNGQQYGQYGQPYGYGRPYGAYGQNQPNQNGQDNQGRNPFGVQPGWYAGNFNPFRLIEEWLPQKAKTTIRVVYGVVGVAAVALGLALLLVPSKTLALAALLLGVYFVISGVVRIVSALVEPGLPGGWRVLDVLVGILLTFGGVVVVRNYGLTGQTLALLITLMVGFGWIMEGVMALVESWRIPHSGWAVAYAIISIIAGFVVLMSPLSSTVFMVIFGGCAMVVMGITAVIRAFTFGKPRK
ncbi:HdeD family acid-resistance protein [Bifidobacterium miconisargentati]|uniref:HdeD family acid-resistance protein n=1 Tax=Bifidobacterium miconisargentati TaxID=2834437 RepID=UPI001BDC656C|nr:HdeD family acid-resistance protein [Bifidobacterium miconisargentati]MBW3089412.1 HdeD family acid-resistance protein [Bifidobacterium miconisargentati]